MSKIYKHSDKIGNEGDLVKHSVLVNALHQLISERQKRGKDCFRYLETHSGKAEYALSGHGKWRNGIGACQRKWNLPKSSSAEKYPMIARYIALTPIGEEEMKYLGSHGFAHTLLTRQSVSYQMLLNDKYPEVCSAVREYYKAYPGVQVNQGDFTLNSPNLLSAKPHFVLIDPPDIKTPHLYVDFMKSLIAADIPFMCWTPRLANSKRPLTSEGANSAKYAAAASGSGIKTFGVQWQLKWSTSCCGCHIAVSDNISKSTSDTLNELGVLMDWHIESN